MKLKIAYYSGWLITRLLSRFLFGIKVIGRENIPRIGGFIMASNHVSYYDPPLVGSWSTRQMAFLAKKELFSNWLFSFVLHRVNALPVSRGGVDRAALRQSVQTIQSGLGLVFFPEGTRSRSDQFLEPRAGMGMVASKAGCPVIPTYLHGPNKLKDCFLRRERMAVIYGEPLTGEWISSCGADKEGYSKIVSTIMDRIGTLKRMYLDQLG